MVPLWVEVDDDLGGQAGANHRVNRYFSKNKRASAYGGSTVEESEANSGLKNSVWTRAIAEETFLSGERNGREDEEGWGRGAKTPKPASAELHSNGRGDGRQRHGDMGQGGEDGGANGGARRAPSASSCPSSQSSASVHEGWVLGRFGVWVQDGRCRVSPACCTVSMNGTIGALVMMATGSTTRFCDHDLSSDVRAHQARKLTAS